MLRTCLALFLALATPGCTKAVMDECGDQGILLKFPCAAARGRLDATELNGACAGSVVLNDVVMPVQEGVCHVVLRFKDGTAIAFDAAVVAGTSGCGGFYATASEDRVFQVPYSTGCCDEPVDGGSFVMPGFDDCSCRCGSSEIVPTTAPGKLACGCGFLGSDYVGGCQTDGDCTLVKAACCGCASGGASMAALTARADAFAKEMRNACGPTGVGIDGCSTVFLCGDATAACAQGRCVVKMTGPDAGLPDSGH